MVVRSKSIEEHQVIDKITKLDKIIEDSEQSEIEDHLNKDKFKNKGRKP